MWEGTGSANTVFFGTLLDVCCLNLRSRLAAWTWFIVGKRLAIINCCIFSYSLRMSSPKSSA